MNTPETKTITENKSMPPSFKAPICSSTSLLFQPPDCKLEKWQSMGIALNPGEPPPVKTLHVPGSQVKLKIWHRLICSGVLNAAKSCNLISEIAENPTSPTESVPVLQSFAYPILAFQYDGDTILNTKGILDAWPIKNPDMAIVNPAQKSIWLYFLMEKLSRMWPNDHKLSHAGRKPGNSAQPKEQNEKS